MATTGRAPRARTSRVPQARELDIVDLSPDGDGIARDGGATVHVPRTIPGERVRVQGSRLDLLVPSPHRVTPRCRHFGTAAAPGLRPPHGSAMSKEAGCGGCAWQHIAYPHQLTLKTQRVARLVREKVPSAPAPAPMISASIDEPWGYRQKVHFVFGDDRGRLVMGHFARGSRAVVGVTECPVHDARGNDLAFALSRQLARGGVQAASARTGGTLRSLVVRTALRTDERMATIVVSDAGERRLRAATRAAMAGSPPATSFHLNVHERDDGFIFGRRTRTLSGTERLRDELAGSSYLMSPTSFFQTNAAAAELLVSEVRRAMPAAPARVLDLYAGAGLFAIALARDGHAVTAVESNRQAVADGVAAARLNRLPESRCRFRVSDVESTPVMPADVVVLDPPREGCTPAVVDLVFGRLRPRTAVYVSCNPETLAADLALAVEHRYRIVRMQPVDMFPHTPHIETVVVLER